MKSGVSWPESIEYFDKFTLAFNLLAGCGRERRAGGSLRKQHPAVAISGVRSKRGNYSNQKR